jgi:hypothetical protein
MRQVEATGMISTFPMFCYLLQLFGLLMHWQDFTVWLGSFSNDGNYGNAISY